VRPVAPRALALLVDLMERSGGKLVEDTLAAHERDAFRALRDTDAIMPAKDVPVVLCPFCGEQDVQPQRRHGGLQALCPECGYVPISNESLKAWQANPEWLLGQLRSALGMAARQASREWVPASVWLVGEYSQKRLTRRVLLASRLSDPVVQTAFRAALDQHVVRDQAVLITTTPQRATPLSDLSLPCLSLVELMHLRAGRLELDEDLWSWSLKPAHLRHHRASTIFCENYRLAVIDGEEFTFSPRQGAVLAYLDSVSGGKCHKDSIMTEIDSAQKNPYELFRHEPRQWAGFQAIAEWDEHGFYWLRRR
jgi:predicted RNA-binding Zn-ribbon protein involved in translation (DUF1610 family)